MRYKASLGSTQRTTTSLFLLFIAGLNLVPVYLHFKSFEYESYFLAGIVIPDIIFVVLFLIAPKSYTVYEKGVHVNSLLKTVRIPFNKIEKVELIRKGDLGESIRAFGVGGFFGNYGKFKSKRYGEMTWYLTNNKHLIMLHTTDDQRIVLSPDDSNMFDEIMAFLKGYT